MDLKTVRAYVLRREIRRPHANGDVFLFDRNIREAARIGEERRDLVSNRLNTAVSKSIRDCIEKFDASGGIDGRYLLKGGVEGRIPAPFTGHKETPWTKNTRDLLKNDWVVKNLKTSREDKYYTIMWASLTAIDTERA